MYFEWIKAKKPERTNDRTTYTYWLWNGSDGSCFTVHFRLRSFFPSSPFMNTIIWFDWEMAFIVRLSISMFVQCVRMWTTHTAYTASSAIADRIGTCYLLSTKCPFMQMMLNLIYWRRCCCYCQCLYTLHTTTPQTQFFSIEKEREEKHFLTSFTLYIKWHNL